MLLTVNNKTIVLLVSPILESRQIQTVRCCDQNFSGGLKNTIAADVQALVPPGHKHRKY